MTTRERDDRRSPSPSPSPSLSHALRVGMAVYGDITHDSRVRREAEALAGAGHQVWLACLPGPGLLDWSPPGVHVFALLPTLSSAIPGSRRDTTAGRSRPARALDLVRWVGGYIANLVSWGNQVATVIADVDVWHLHDLPALMAVARHVPASVPIVYDSHELFLDTGIATRLPEMLRTVLRRRERALVRRSDTVVTVNEALETVLRRRYRPRRTAVVYNAPPRREPYRGPDLLRTATGIRADVPIVIHHGQLGPASGLEQLVEAMLDPAVGQAHLVLLGYGPLRPWLAEQARDPRFGGRIHLLDAVPPEDVVKWISTADVEAVPRPGVDINFRLATPNKLFESLAAGVPLVASDLPGMRSVILDPGGDLGVLCDPTSPSSIALAIAGVLGLPEDDRIQLRARCLDAAATRWNWEAEVQKLLAVYDRLSRRPVGRVGDRPGD